MKKSLALIASAAMAFSLFSSVAFAADASTTTSTTSTLTTEDMMKDLGFTGTDHDYLDRASAAVSILKGLGIAVDNSATLPFVDVNASDAWAPYIATAAKLGIVHGNDATHYAPFDKISQQDYVIELVLAYAAKTGTKVDTTATADVNASGYAKAYIAAALDLGVVDASDDWTGTASYDWMVKGAYATKQAVAAAQQPAKASVTSAKAVGASKIEVNLNKAVDTDKATFTVEVDGASVTVSKKDWSDDKKTVTLELDNKIQAGNYTVTLGGLGDSAIDKATGTFVGQDEAVKSIEFVTASDTVPYSKHVTLKLKAVNQYGEMVSMGTTDFSAFVSGNSADVSINNDGYLNVKFDTTSLGYNQGTGVVPVTVYDNTNRVTVSKNFNLGTTPFPSKVEIGQVTYSNGNDNLSKSGDTASIAMKVYDQFGNEMTKDQFAATPDPATNGADAAYSTLNAIITPYDQNIEYVHSTESDLFDTNDNIRALVKLTDDEDKNQSLTVTVYAGSGSATTTLHVGAGAKPVKVSFGDFTSTVAQGDTGAFYMPIVAYDANGNKLSAQDIVDNTSEFSFSVSNSDQTSGKEPSIVQYGDHKGQVKFYLDSNARARSILYFTLVVANANVNTSATKQVTVQPVRHPNKVVIDTTPAVEYLADANDKLSFQIKDQYGDDMGSALSNIPDSNNTKYYDYRYSVETSGDASSGLTFKQGTTSGTTITSTPTTSFDKDTMNGDFFFVADSSANTGTLTVKAKIQRADHGDTNWSDVSTITFSAKKIANDSSLTYTLDSIPDLYAVKDQIGKFLLANPDGSGDTKFAETDVQNAVNTSFFAYQVGATAKDGAGNKVALPADAVKNVVSSNRNIVDYYYGVNNASAGDSDSLAHGYLLGGVAGTATVTAQVYTNKGTTLALSQQVTVKADPIMVDSISADDSANNWDSSNPDVFNYFSDLIVKDQYGNEYDGEATEITKFNELLGLTYTVTSIDGTGTVTIDKYGNITKIDSGVRAFVVTATAPNGKSVSVTVNNATAYTAP